MDLLAYWRWDNYVADLEEGAGFHFNSNQKRLHESIEFGESLWIVTGRAVAGGTAYPLVGRLVVRAKTLNAPGYKYGRYRVWGDLERSRYFIADGPDASALLRHLRFEKDVPIRGQRIAQALQTMRALTQADTLLLEAWSRDLAEEPRATSVPDEGELERALAADDRASRDVLDRALARASDAARRRLSEVARRNRRLAEDLRARYRGRCQLCAFDPEVLYGRGICEAHHIVYLSRGGDDAIENMLLVCPNHHEAIHATSAVFDFRDLHYHYPGGRREPLVLNDHLRAA
jgi:5-methylcytosine-specific restriction protein A